MKLPSYDLPLRHQSPWQGTDTPSRVYLCSSSAKNHIINGYFLKAVKSDI